MCHSYSVSSLPGLPRIQFRDHILTFTPWYLAAEVVEEAAAAAVATALVEEDGSADAVKLVHLMQSSTPPKRIRITGIGQQDEKLLSIGNKLEKCALAHGITLKFTVVESNLENLRLEDIKVEDGEKVIVNSILQLHCVVRDSMGALNTVLQAIHKLSPKVLVLVEQDSSHNGSFFLGRFVEALHYYSTIFDSLEATMPRYDTRRAKVEQFYYAEEIRNIVSCKGLGRVERHERVDQWRRRMSRAGFQSTPIRMMGPAKEWLGKNSGCEGYTLVEEKGCPVLGWKSKPIVAVSCWKC
ncbi:hypothetical protein MLD38_026087 [Melastoma candidum]|uniref:Uncharacterized protein n=1 Tax=Melastoma candidum TaxID=119954 RepID=A0ACB9NYE7_9MYRT|nr:hypothetical protein MLD38_026087 [Melastoma candidum]